MSDIATRANERNASVVDSTSAPARPVRRSYSRVPSHAHASARATEASTATSRAAAAEGPSAFIAAAIAQYVRIGLSKNAWPS